MAKYRVLAKSFINNALVEEGTIVEYDGVPSDNLEPIDKPAEKAAAQSAAADIESLARQKVAAAGASPDEVDTTAAVSAAAEAAQAAIGTAPNAAAGLV
ncbi:MAG TPA: hypothetical protein VFM48_05100 [Aquabacterium sp.]|nr:hypothetical protein [Aquabacterium sp.]